MSAVTYCTNIHPGESWAQTLASLENHTLAVKAALSPDEPFPVGLRVSGQASLELDIREAERFRHWLALSGLYVRTLNGFPYGRFHHVPVKAGVYLPDWRDPERLAYTKRLADLLGWWLPDDGSDAGPGSISTVPLGFRDGFDPGQEGLAFRHLRQALEHLDAVAQRTGKLIRLSLEPEPGCLLETTVDVVDFFRRFEAPPSLSPYLAVCYDCCHQALQFEDPAASLTLLADNAVPIGHVQVSSALHLESGCLDRLARFDEPVYLHQAVGRRSNGELLRLDDLPQALAGGRYDVESWRVHFHLPVFLAELPECLSTQGFLQEALPRFDPQTPLEVETYTWSVLPAELRACSLTESIIREISWVEAHRRPGRTPGPPPWPACAGGAPPR
ncbi:metabolite traffic protein EboE [Fundidesulfovibrio soli]|uniref:metabolite traffic protein EboE n=1 Tax=Fundidesulfovibrio soli TaxID=2922716 RepID=UPI001FB04254|nr:metabolite traffic protein EboE [Fundidesulfovibrio soli]